MPAPSQPENQKKAEQIWLAKQVLEQKTSLLGSKFKEHASTAIITAFGLIVALAWKDVITDFITKLNPFTNSNLLFSALIVTFLAVIGISIVSYWSKQPQKSKK